MGGKGKMRKRLMNISKRCMVAIMSAAFIMSSVTVSMVFPVGVYAEVVPDNPENTTLYVLNSNSTMDTNKGTIQDMVGYSSLNKNEGTVNNMCADAQIRTNLGNVGYMDGSSKIITNNGTVDTMYGLPIIETNNGTVKTNNATVTNSDTGKVENNYWVVSGSGTITNCYLDIFVIIFRSESCTI